MFAMVRRRPARCRASHGWRRHGIVSCLRGGNLKQANYDEKAAPRCTREHAGTLAEGWLDVDRPDESHDVNLLHGLTRRFG